MNSANLKEKIANSNSEQLLSLLKNATVTTGHFGGRKIHVQGFEGSVTFTEFKKAVETLYQTKVSPMQEKQKKYEYDCSSAQRIRPGFFTPIFFQIPFLMGEMAIKNTLDAVNSVICAPEISEEEEIVVAKTLEWRNLVDNEFVRLTETSQNEINQLSPKSCTGRIMKRYDAFLNTENAVKNNHAADQLTLDKMIATRKSNTVYTKENIAMLATRIAVNKGLDQLSEEQSKNLLNGLKYVNSVLKTANDPRED